MKRSLLARLEKLEKRNPQNGGWLAVPVACATVEEWVAAHGPGTAEVAATIYDTPKGFGYERGPIVERHGQVVHYQLLPGRPS